MDTGRPPSPKPVQMLIAGKPVTLHGMVKDGFSMPDHLGTLSIRGASAGCATP